MNHDQWTKATTDEKLNWLRTMALERLDQANNLASRIASLGFTYNGRFDEHANEIISLRQRLEALETGSPNPAD